jgi:transcription-repair coupling factor (superfamily II helicase)
MTACKAQDPRPAVGATHLTPGPAPLEAEARPSPQAPASAVAAALGRAAQTGRRKVIVHLASSERRADEIARSLAALAPRVDTAVLPPWDCLPYDRASPSRDVMGRRLQVLRRLGQPSRACRVVVTSPEALVLKTPPRTVVTRSLFELRPGERLDREALEAFALRSGYVVDDRIDEPGEIAFLGGVVDVFPADASRPVRLVVGEEGQLVEIRAYDPLTQRSDDRLAGLSLGPASEAITPPDADPSDRTPGMEHELSTHYAELETLFDWLPRAALSQDPTAAEALVQAQAHIEDAYEARRALGGLDRAAPPPGALYLLGPDLAARLKTWTPLALDLTGVEVVSRPAGTRNPGRAFCDLVEAHRQAGRRVILAGLKAEQRALARALARGLDLEPAAATEWEAALAAEPGAVLALEADIESGFLDAAAGVAVIAGADVLGGRLAARRRGEAPDLLADPDLRPGDVVLHEDHGIGVLRDLKTLVVDGHERDTLELEFHGGARLMAPVEDIGKIWRYGAEPSAVALDRLQGQAWPQRRAEVARQVDETARGLAALAAARAAARRPPSTPPRAAYAKFAARFAYPETPDQTAAIEAVLADLASGRPMDRLVCGDVGFGKTEVALRAAAAVALSGRQVALAAPTTVLARQHFETFQRRFAGFGVKVAQLSRLVSPAEAKAVREGLAAGDIGVVIGTHALAGDAIAFADLGLMIIDEEQKFGAALKDDLRNLAAGGHLLAMTATPIPRTLQAAMVGVQEVSVIASPPARRRPIRTFMAPFDAATLRTALLREHRRGGQSFVVVPRIQDIATLAERLGEIAPELSVRVAHGELTPDLADAVMVGFADGDGDVLLATNIIESGLDVPRANTMVIWRPDRFGLAQLHQLRGRVGRGRAQGIAYLLSDPEDDLSDVTRARLSTLEAFDRLGSGLSISARDLDLRGGGDLTGDAQAGHVKMIGAALYQRLLNRALRAAMGEAVEDDWTPVLNLGELGGLPSDYVPDAVTRINLHARLARLAGPEEIDNFEAELEDRFGPLPPPATALLAVARLQRLARAAGVRQVGVGPKGLALQLAPGHKPRASDRLKRLAQDITIRDDRLVIAGPPPEGAARFKLIERLLESLAT